MAIGVRTDTTPREIPPWLKQILSWDQKVTKSAFDLFDKKFGYVKHRPKMKMLEYSGAGYVWLVGGVLVMLYMGSDNLELWMNLLAMLLIDIVIVAVTKAAWRRRRPAYNTDDMLSVSVDKFSFPSGHASRVAGLMFFFTLLYPLNIILQVPIVLWAVAVMISRVTLGRHHILDVFGGLLVGFLEYLITAAIWMDKETAGSWAEYFGAEDPWSSA